jgi:serine kinase of HPr protein (carbohydrate metabolism regulator)
MAIVAASCVEIFGLAVLLRGPSASGKSDLALRLIDGGARLVADDQVELRAVEGTLRATPPPALAGLIELRGIGLLRLATVTDASVGLVVDLAPDAPPERLPEPSHCVIEGIAVPRIAIEPFQASAAARVRGAARALRDDASYRGALGDRPS